VWNSFRAGATFVDMSRIEIESNQPNLMNEQTFTISDAIRSTRTEDGCVLLDIRQGLILGLNPVGSNIFELLQRGFDQPRIADIISKQFGVDLQTVRTDVLAFVETLQAHNILQTNRVLQQTDKERNPWF
jgi:hypothetical protein